MLLYALSLHKETNKKLAAMKNLSETLRDSKLLRVEKNEINFNAQLNDYKAKIIYYDAIYFTTLSKEILAEIIQKKVELISKVNFNSRKYAIQEDLTKEEFDFVVLCDKKRISRKAIIG